MLHFVVPAFDIPNGGDKLDSIIGGPWSEENSSASWVAWW